MTRFEHHYLQFSQRAQDSWILGNFMAAQASKRLEEAREKDKLDGGTGLSFPVIAGGFSVRDPETGILGDPASAQILTATRELHTQRLVESQFQWMLVAQFESFLDYLRDIVAEIRLVLMLRRGERPADIDVAFKQKRAKIESMRLASLLRNVRSNNGELEKLEKANKAGKDYTFLVCLIAQIRNTIAHSLTVVPSELATGARGGTGLDEQQKAWMGRFIRYTGPDRARVSLVRFNDVRIGTSDWSWGIETLCEYAQLICSRCNEMKAPA